MRETTGAAAFAIRYHTLCAAHCSRCTALRDCTTELPTDLSLSLMRTVTVCARSVGSYFATYYQNAIGPSAAAVRSAQAEAVNALLFPLLRGRMQAPALLLQFDDLRAAFEPALRDSSGRCVPQGLPGWAGLSCWAGLL